MADVFTHFNYLHTIPEIGMKEFKTSAYVADVLKQLGYEVETQVGGATGVVAVCDSGKPGPVLGLRADMDALGTKDGGAAHLCGHDGHMAMLLAAAEEIMEDTQPILVVQRLCAALQPSEVFAEIGVYPVKKGAGLIHVLPSHRNRDVLVLNQIVALCGLVGQDAVVLPAVTVQTVPSLPHQDTAAKVCAVQPSVVDGNFCGGIRGQHSAVGSEHIPLIVMGGQRVVNIRKAPSTAEFSAGLPDTVPIDPLDGNGLLDAPGDTEPLPFTAVCGKQGLNHKCSSPFHSEFCSTDFQSGTPSAPRTKSAT